MRILVLLALIMLTPAAWADELVPLTVTTPAGDVHAFEVEVADTPEERGRGLMHRDELAADRGMLFVFPRRERIAMWMRNTRIPLDMLFIDHDGQVLQIHERAVPYSEETIASRRRVRYVLELVGGSAERLGIGEGAVVASEAMR